MFTQQQYLYLARACRLMAMDYEKQAAALSTGWHTIEQSLSAQAKEWRELAAKCEAIGQGKITMEAPASSDPPAA